MAWFACIFCAEVASPVKKDILELEKMGLLKRSSIDRHGYGRILIIFLISCRLLLLVIMNDFSPGESPQSVIRNLENDIEINMGNISDLSRTFSDLVLWSSDFHISPIADIKNIVAHYGVRVIDKSLSDHCHLSNTCQTDLRVINKQNGINLGGCPNSLKSSFYDSYINDEEMKTVSAFLCTHAASLCEIFMPFDRPMIVIASTRWGNYNLRGSSLMLWNTLLAADFSWICFYHSQWYWSPVNNDVVDERTYSDAPIIYAYAYVHSYIHAYIRTYRHPHIHTYIHTCIHTYILHIYMHTYVHTYIHTYMHTYIHTYIHT